ncbi:hypothetical protein NIES593_12325 [Hydrococcus rivularis NIES-593]|uniref:DUF2808 domain-containing protein n=1 Tax=Hydrococcus rivularis NIES-593 TaxID=1921803 RepID=A0A1U7HG59_9CYAN|nr:DUF2808 domain-containing protein [Hydrococcus rivularis]OKH22573.1 hypothetical protein NIES593_12325 [Hydrococcus rivularis NIES-593]
MQNFISKITLSLASILIVSLPSARAIELEGGRTAFESSPRLLDAATTFNSVRAWGAKYYFTIALPENLGEPLGKLAIQQRQGGDTINFNVDETFAFAGTRSNKGDDLFIKTANLDEETNTISLVFEPPILPGTTFTVGLKPKRNPDFGGVYLFGVTAFPVGDKPEGLYLGVGRLNFYDSNDNKFFGFP